jgi:hypothetical protein
MAVKLALEARGTKLERPLNDRDLKSFERELGLSLDQYFRQLYSSFDGFLACDKNTQLSFSTKRILENRGLSIGIDDEKYYAVGDLLIDSDFLMCCLEKENRPIFLLYEKRKLAPSASIFFSKFIAGEFDFMA